MTGGGLEMADFTSKVKNTLQKGLKAVKRGAEILAEKTPEVAATVAGKTQEAVNIGKINLQIQSRERDIDRGFRDLGKGVYALVKKKAERIENDANLRKTVKTVDALKKEIRELEKMIEKLKT
jgi:uncharacterized protein Yka (UPF0111/DUF47 family)